MTCLTQSTKLHRWKIYRKCVDPASVGHFEYYLQGFPVSVCLSVFRKVMLLEGEDGNIHLKNLSMHLAANEEEGECATK